MTTPFEIIQEFSTQEKQKFKLFVKNSVTKKESKLTEFISLLYGGLSSKTICEKLYGVYPHSGFYALRKRTTDLLIQFYAFEKEKEADALENHVRQYFEAGKKLILNKKYKLGFDCLNKALVKAKDNEFYSLVSAILFEYIQGAHIDNRTDLSELVKEYEEIQKTIKKEDTIAIAYAEVKQQLNLYYKYSISDKVLKEINKVFKKYNLSLDEDLTFRTLYQLAQLTFAKSTVTKTFVEELIDFEKRAKNMMQHKYPKNYNQWVFKFKLDYMLAISNYRAKRFVVSNEYLDNVIRSLNKELISLPKELEFKLTVLKSLNINYLGNNLKAYKLLKKFLRDSTLNKHNKNWLDGYGALTMILFHGKRFNEVLKWYENYSKSDQYYIEKNGVEWVLRKNLILVLTHFELKNTEKSRELLNEFRSNYSAFLKKDLRTFFFLMCVEKVIFNPFQATNPHFHKFVESKLDKKPRFQEDIFVLSFFAWLKAKMLNQDTYSCTIDIISNLDIDH